MWRSIGTAMKLTPVERLLKNLHEEIPPHMRRGFLPKGVAYERLKQMTGQDFGDNVGEKEEARVPGSRVRSLTMRVLAIAAFVTLPLLPVPSAGEWVVEGTGAEMALVLAADRPIAGAGLLGKQTIPKLALRCHEGRPRLALDDVDLAEPGGPVRQPEVTLRFDRDEARTENLGYELAPRELKDTLLDRNRRRLAGYFFHNPEKEVAAILGHHRLLIRLYPEGGGSQNADFSLAGLEELLPDFERACGMNKPFPRPSAPLAELPASPPSASASPGLVQHGAWELSESVSRLDDRAVVVLSQTSEAKVRTKYASVPVTLVLRCREEKAEAYFHFGGATLVGYGGLIVQVSADGDKVKPWSLAPSTDYRSFFHWSAPQLLKRLLASRQLKLVMGPRKRHDADAWMGEGEVVFKTDGLEEASRPFIEACDIRVEKIKVKDGLEKIPKGL
jgi:hypothetical protein